MSLKFAPGLKKEFTVIGERLRAKGTNIRYLLANNYKFIGNDFPETEYISNSNNLKEILWDSFKFISSKQVKYYFDNDQNIAFILFYNPHILNLFVARHIKKTKKNIPTMLYLHDPYKPDKRPYGFSKSIYISLVELVQKMTVKYLDHIIFPSQYSYQLFLNHYAKYHGQKHIAPLLVPDQGDKQSNSRELFTIVGGYHNGTGHDTFIDLVNYVAAHKLNYKFALISSSNIDSLTARISPEAKSYIEIINKKLIDDAEINNLILRSYAVFRLDREVTQSGVIPVAYMNSTPIIARDIPGLAQHVTQGHNGYITPLECTSADLIEAMDLVKENFAELSSNARKSYEEIWSDANFDKYYHWLSLL